jgi:Zn-dependent peptidase ImmA (M78 family)
VNRKNGCEIDVENIARRLNINILRDEMPDNISGAFIIKGKKLTLGVNASHSSTRQRFTIAHEIGHYLLHSNETLHFDKNINDNEIFFRSDISSLSEVEANHFAAELLMPKDLVEIVISKGVTAIEKLADLFNVSSDAMKYRLINLGIL